MKNDKTKNKPQDNPQKKQLSMSERWKNSGKNIMDETPKERIKRKKKEHA